MVILRSKILILEFDLYYNCMVKNYFYVDFGCVW